MTPTRLCFRMMGPMGQLTSIPGMGLAVPGGVRPLFPAAQVSHPPSTRTAVIT